MVLWHGFLGTGFAWREVMPVLLDSGVRVLVLDLLGNGDSDKPAGTDGYDAGALAGAGRELAFHLGVAAPGRPVTLVGHDMGAPPALLWAARHPHEVCGVVYVEEPVMLGDTLRGLISYTPSAMADGSLWWWVLAMGPGVPEALVVGREEAFLRWFFDGPAGAGAVSDPATVGEYLRTFSGREGVLGAMGVYRAAFTSIAQTEPLQKAPVTVPVVAVGGEAGIGAQVATMLEPVTVDLRRVTLADVGHFVPEQAPRELARIVVDLVTATHEGELP